MAVNQHITYNEHLPVLLGNQAQGLVDNIAAVEPEVLPVGGFIPAKQSDPTVRNEFAVAGYRWGHAMLMDEFSLSDKNLNPHNPSQIDTVNTFFNPDTVYQQGPGACLRGAMTRFTGEISQKFWPTFQNNLFRPQGATHGSDLLSFNIAVSLRLRHFLII